MAHQVQQINYAEPNHDGFEIIKPGELHISGHADDRRYYLFAFHGYVVPQVVGWKLEDGSWNLTLDGRYGYEIKGEDPAGGYTSFGKNSLKVNPFGPNSKEYRNEVHGTAMSEVPA